MVSQRPHFEYNVPVECIMHRMFLCVMRQHEHGRLTRGAQAYNEMSVAEGANRSQIQQHSTPRARIAAECRGPCQT